MNKKELTKLAYELGQKYAEQEMLEKLASGFSELVGKIGEDAARALIKKIGLGKALKKYNIFVHDVTKTPRKGPPSFSGARVKEPRKGY